MMGKGTQKGRTRMNKKQYDFSGWATVTNLKCADGRTIKPGAFHGDNGKSVPLVWQHQHNTPENVLGHGLLEERADGVYLYGTFNDTDLGLHAKKLVQHGDITSLSIYANQLKQNGGDVIHGSIKEVSLVLAGANPGAVIDVPMVHGEDTECDGYIYTGEEIVMNKKKQLRHEEEPLDVEEEEEEEEDLDPEEIFDSMTDEQKALMYYMVAQASGANEGDEEDDEDDEDDEEEPEMKHNVFDAEPETEENTLSHAEIETIMTDARRMGSLRDSVLAHSDEYGIADINWLFPNDRTMENTPDFIKRNQDWVARVMNGVHHSPFSRVKSIFADITADAARARGYIKGNMKKNEVFTLLKRSTTPQTIYKKQKLDRDDIVDITDFDVVAWLKGEMRLMLDEEIARAILIGDGRETSDPDHISHDHIRPIWTDASLYTIRVPVAAGNNEAEAKAFIKAAIKARKDYQGSGNPVLFTTETMLTEMLLLEDTLGHFLYPNQEALANTMRVSGIITVPVMDTLKERESRLDETTSKHYLPMGIIVNLTDYNVGADKGGAVNMFDDFDIDYNQQKYLIETRCSGALVKPYSAIVLEKEITVTQQEEEEEQES